MPRDVDGSHDVPPSTALYGKRVLVTRARAQAHELVTRLQELGAVPIVFSVIHIVPPVDNYGALDARCASSRHLIGSSLPAPTRWSMSGSAWPCSDWVSGAFETVRIVAIGPATAVAPHDPRSAGGRGTRALCG